MSPRFAVLGVNRWPYRRRCLFLTDIFFTAVSNATRRASSFSMRRCFRIEAAFSLVARFEVLSLSTIYIKVSE